MNKHIDGKPTREYFMMEGRIYIEIAKADNKVAINCASMIIAFTYNCCYINVTHRQISSIIPGWFL